MRTVEIQATEETKGLSIRADYASAKVRAIHQPDIAGVMLLNACTDAYNLGCHDYVAGESCVPTMFADVDDLRIKWQKGFNDTANMRALPLQETVIRNFEELIETAMVRGARVAYSTTQGVEAGFYGYRGLLHCVGPCATEHLAWEQLLIDFALVRPGHLWLTSEEFGEVATPNVICPSGKLGCSFRRFRLEIRNMGKAFQVYLVDRLYPPETEPYDRRQSREDKGRGADGFADIGAAAAFAAQFIRDYCDAAADYIEDALEFQQREMESMDDD